MKTIKTFSNKPSEFNKLEDRLNGTFIAKTSVFITAEISLVLISLLIVSTSSLVIYRITKAQVKKVRSDFSFICLSVSDMGVGLFSIPLQCIVVYYQKNSQNAPFILRIPGNFFQFFPYTFSCLFTAVVAVDRMFVITLAQRYKCLVTPKILKVIAIILFLCSVTNSSILTIHNMQSRSYNTRWVHDFSIGYSIVPLAILALATLSTFVVIVTHLYILYFTLRRTELKQLRKHQGKNSNGRRLTNTISCICISQLICLIPYLIFRLVAYRLPDKLYFNIFPWLGILAYCQCFCNALVILRNIKAGRISKQIGRGKMSTNNTSQMEMRL